MMYLSDMSICCYKMTELQHPSNKTSHCFDFEVQEEIEMHGDIKNISEW